MFRVYDHLVVFNNWVFREIWIDTHYEIKHAKYIDDSLILALLGEVYSVLTLNKNDQAPYEYYEVDVQLNAKTYRLILVVPESKRYLGVRNAYRRKL